MEFTLEKALDILERIPDVLFTLLQNLSSDWTSQNEGPETWSVYDVIGHLIHCERAGWISRVQIIHSKDADATFKPFDRSAHFEESKGKSLTHLLNEFRSLREKSLQTLISKNLTKEDLASKGLHPVFGEVTLSQLLATWTVHDLNHIAQIVRIMSKQYHNEVGPWQAYLGILQR
jgi:uncharacterized damage-inducible protein DinB